MSTVFMIVCLFASTHVPGVRRERAPTALDPIPETEAPLPVEPAVPQLQTTELG
jgi:hypothetical protein